MLRHATLTSCFALLVACTGMIGETGDRVSDDAAASTAISSFECNDATARGASQNGMRRLSSFELQATLQAILPAATVAAVQPLIDTYPTDHYRNSVADINPGQVEDHVKALFHVASTVAERLVTNDTELRTLAPDCYFSSASPGASCIKGFITTFGLRAFHRPLDAAEVDDFHALYAITDDAISTKADRMEVLIGAILSDPEVAFHVERRATEAPTPDGRAKVDAYTVAARLAYRTTGAPPDTALLQTVADGSISELTTVEAQARRLLESPAGHAHVRSMFDLWGSPARRGSPSDKAAEHGNIDPSDIDVELKNEMLDFVEHTVFAQHGSFADLMTSTATFPKTARLAKMLGTSQSDGPVANAQRPGLLTHPSLLMGTDYSGNPILRGVFIVKNVLCRAIGTPPPDADAVAAEAKEELDPLTSTARTTAAQATSSAVCAACHSQINPLGYTLGHFDALGVYGDDETIFDSSGTPISSAAVDATITDFALDVGSVSIEGAGGLAQTLATSVEAQACLVVQLFRLTRLQLEQKSDACVLHETDDVVSSGGTLFDAIIETVASPDIFYTGAQ